MQMATEKTSEGAQGSSKVNKNVIKSKRRRFQDDDDGESSQVDNTLKKDLAKTLSDYLDRTIEDVDVCDKEDKKSNVKKREEQVDGFQLFSSSQQMALETFPEEKQRCDEEDAKASLSSDDDDETTARFKEAAISVQDLFGPKFNHDTKTV
ncbi:Hypothetical predicted protein [Paramuricea clavata]|uniref:Protein CUSTOS n=1 Tax=Paramuricea clavata TaxID=317549 RepID=A0A7D9E2H7_PARCT|nr:Hypothetical predicted protein [Paramuricea clavata]